MSNSLPKPVVEALYRRYWFQVEQRCRRLLARPEDARDAAQEVFLRLITQGGEFRGDAEWMTWLYRVATNTCLNRLRDVRRRGDAWIDAVARDGERSAENVEERLGHRALLELILEESDDVTQQIAVLHFVDEMTQEEIGQVLGLSRVTINKRLKKLRERAERVRMEER